MENCSRTFLAVCELQTVKNSIAAAWGQAGKGGDVREGRREPQGSTLIRAWDCPTSPGRERRADGSGSQELLSNLVSFSFFSL